MYAAQVIIYLTKINLHFKTFFKNTLAIASVQLRGFTVLYQYSYHILRNFRGMKFLLNSK